MNLVCGQWLGPLYDCYDVTDVSVDRRTAARTGGYGKAQSENVI